MSLGFLSVYTSVKGPLELDVLFDVRIRIKILTCRPDGTTPGTLGLVCDRLLSRKQKREGERRGGRRREREGSEVRGKRGREGEGRGEGQKEQREGGGEEGRKVEGVGREGRERKGRRGKG